MLLVQDIRPLPREPQQRFVTIAAVAGLHVVVIAGILISLNKSFAPPLKDLIITEITPPKSTEAPPPPPKPVLATPKVVDVPPPDVTIASDPDAHPIANVDPVQPQRADPVVRTFPAQAIVGSHTTPDYPPLDRRLGHEGNVLLKLTIDEWGAVTSAQVERSSGYEGLDRAAAEWVKTHWLYHPATRSGDPIPSTTEALVTFRLTDR